jgi:hypothetical protein
MRPAAQHTGRKRLRPGERLTQAEFHRRYEQHTDKVKFELIGGVVHMASPARLPHSNLSALLGYVLVSYMGATPGTQAASDATTILDDQAEPQPDLLLRILPEYGGRTSDDDEQYLHNGPEFVAQIAHSTLALDLGARREDCERAGVGEYLVVDIPDVSFHWFDFRRGVQITASRGGAFRSRVFPGLWIDPAALFAGDVARLTEVIQEGIASPAHGRFVQRLERARRRRSGER